MSELLSDPFVVSSTEPRIQINLAVTELSLADARLLWSRLGAELDRLEHPKPAE